MEARRLVAGSQGRGNPPSSKAEPRGANGHHPREYGDEPGQKRPTGVLRGLSNPTMGRGATVNRPPVSNAMQNWPCGGNPHDVPNRWVIDRYKGSERNAKNGVKMSRRCGVTDVLKVTTSLMREHGDAKVALQMLAAVKDAGIDPDAMTYTAAISACEKCGLAEPAKELLGQLEAQKKNYPGNPEMWPDVVAYNATIAACAADGDPESAVKLLIKMEEQGKEDPRVRPDVVSYTSAISACARVAMAEAALLLLERLKELGQKNPDNPKLRPNVYAYNAAISACAKAGEVAAAFRLLDELKALGKKDETMRPDAISYTSAITACEAIGSADSALQLLRELEVLGGQNPHNRNMRPTVIAYNTTISACAKGGRERVALSLFEKLKELAKRDKTMCPNIVSYNVAISACEKGRLPDMALTLLDDLKRLARDNPEMRPDLITYSAVIGACAPRGGPDRMAALIDDAIRQRVIKKNAGYSAEHNLVNFHVDAVFVDAPDSNHPRGVQLEVALVILDYHQSKNKLNPGTKYIVGQHGGDVLKNGILERLGPDYEVSSQNNGMLHRKKAPKK